MRLGQEGESSWLGGAFQPRSPAPFQPQSSPVPFQPQSSSAPFQQRSSPASSVPFQSWSSPARDSSSQAPIQEQASPGRFQLRSRERESCSPVSFQPRSSPVSFQPRSSPVSFQPRSSPVSFQPRSSPVRAIRRLSPVHYRHNPLDHEENEDCLCGKKARIFISWSDFPGRRYFSCMYPPSDSRRCEFFKWYDVKAFPQYITNLLGDLRDKVDEQERELVVLRGQLQIKEQELGDLEEQMDQLWRTT